MGDVEFVSDDQPAPLPPPPPTSRRVWIVRIAVVVVAIAAGAAWVATRPSAAPRQQARPAHTAAPHRLPLIHPVQSVVSCVAGAPVDDEITHAMHRFIRGIAIENMQAARCVERLHHERQVIAETVTGLIGRDEVQVSVSRRNASYVPPPRIARLGARQANVPIGGVETMSAGLKVRIIVSGPAPDPVAMLRIHSLADFLCLNLPL